MCNQYNYNTECEASIESPPRCRTASLKAGLAFQQRGDGVAVLWLRRARGPSHHGHSPQSPCMCCYRAPHHFPGRPCTTPAGGILTWPGKLPASYTERLYPDLISNVKKACLMTHRHLVIQPLCSQASGATVTGINHRMSEFLDDLWHLWAKSCIAKG